MPAGSSFLRLPPQEQGHILCKRSCPWQLQTFALILLPPFFSHHFFDTGLNLKAAVTRWSSIFSKHLWWRRRWLVQWRFVQPILTAVSGSLITFWGQLTIVLGTQQRSRPSFGSSPWSWCSLQDLWLDLCALSCSWWWLRRDSVRIVTIQGKCWFWWQRYCCKR